MREFGRGVRGAWARSRPAAWLQAHSSLRFAVVGALNTLFGFAVYTAALLAGMRPHAALLLGMVMGSIFNFFMTGGYAFRELSWRRFPKFVVCYLGIYAINALLIEWLAALAGGPLAAQAIAVVPMALLSYWVMSRWVFASA